MRLLRKIAFPIALLYGAVVRLRNLCYDTGVFTSNSFGTPTLCVGNLSVGGTGKTPMVELLVRQLQSKRRLAVLSRGYRRKTRGFVLAGANSSAEEIGDEPLQLQLKFPNLIVAVDANRSRGIKRLEAELAPDLILLDDAFQHRKVRPDLSLLLTAYNDLYTDDWYLPVGNLRDSRREARRADLIIVTKCPAELSEEEQSRIILKLKPESRQQVLFCTLEYDPFLGGRGVQPLQLEDLKQKQLTLLTGIARPEPLKAFLKASGIEFEHLRYPDHYYFGEEVLREIRQRPFVLTTEKDYRRIPKQPDTLYYIGIRHRFLGKGLKILEERLRDL